MYKEPYGVGFLFNGKIDESQSTYYLLFFFDTCEICEDNCSIGFKSKSFHGFLNPYC
nr:MAG TPA: Thioredoxin [Caudoviricetes sp.]